MVHPLGRYNSLFRVLANVFKILLWIQICYWVIVVGFFVFNPDISVSEITSNNVIKLSILNGFWTGVLPSVLDYELHDFILLIALSILSGFIKVYYLYLLSNVFKSLHRIEVISKKNINRLVILGVLSFLSWLKFLSYNIFFSPIIAATLAKEDFALGQMNIGAVLSHQYHFIILGVLFLFFAYILNATFYEQIEHHTLLEETNLIV